MSQYHEKPEEMDSMEQRYIRALVSLKEEIEAINWYSQRTSVSDDRELLAILEHNKREEMEHAAMLLEWLRRSMDGWDDALRMYLMTEAPILEIEELADSAADSERSDANMEDLGVGRLQEKSSR